MTTRTQTPTTDGGQTPSADAAGDPGSPTPQTPPAEPKAKAPESYQPFTLPAEIIQGLKEYIVAESGNVLLICKKDEEQRIKQYMADAQIKYGQEFS